MITWTQARAQLARAVQLGEPPEVVAELRRQYHACRLGYQITRTAPVLTERERAHLAKLVLNGGDTNAAA